MKLLSMAGMMEMNEKIYPFKLKDELDAKLPKPSRDGYIFIDARVNGNWEGILVFDKRRLSIGIRCDRKILEYHPGFSPDEIEDIRPASLWNRTLACLPSRLVLAYPYACFLIIPALLCIDVNHAPAGSILAILSGLIAQKIVIDHLSAFCLTNLLIIIAILGFQAAALQSLIKTLLR